jgi:hypothetical protein
MQILEAVDCLVEELGIACGANDETFRTQIGDGIANAVTSVQPWSEPGARGGDITIKLDGEAQPEAARTLQGIIDVILIKLELPTSKRRKTPDFEGTGRKIVFAVPDDRADMLAESLVGAAGVLRNMPELKQQYHQATDFSLKTINAIPGAKPFIRLIVPGLNDVPWQKAGDYPYFNLQMQGVPGPLTKTLAATMGVDVDFFEASGDRQSRDLSKDFRGGKTIDIAMNADYTAAVFADIENYVGAKRLSPGNKIRGFLKL